MSRWPLVASAAAVIAVHVPLIAYGSYANVDEGYVAALAERLNEGYRLYEGAISQRGPLFYYAWALLARTSGWDNVAAVRVAALVVALAQVAAVTFVATRLFSRRAGIVAALLSAYVLTTGLPPIDGLALHAESLQAPLLVLAAYLAVREPRWVVASGLLFGAAIAIKQSAALQPIPTLLWLLFHTRSRRSALVFALSCAAVPLAFVLHAATIGTLRPFFYYTVTYNLEVHLRGELSMSLRFLFDDITQMPGFVLGLALLVFASGRSLDLRSYFSAHVLVATLSAMSLARFFPHYFIPAAAFLAIALASHARPQRLTLRAAVVALLVAAGATTFMNEKADGRVMHDDLPLRLGRYVEATTKPDARIFVWGFSPWIYGYAHRRPAGRFVFATYVTGLVPWFYDALPHEAERAVPGAEEQLVGDLEREAPEVVIDAGSVEIARPLRAYPRMARWLESAYCFEVRVGAYDVYRRRGPAGCETDRLPAPHAPFDFVARAMHVPMPASNGHPLCQPRYEDVAWFSGQSPPARVDLLGGRAASGALPTCSD